MSVFSEEIPIAGGGGIAHLITPRHDVKLHVYFAYSSTGEVPVEVRLFPDGLDNYGSSVVVWRKHLGQDGGDTAELFVPGGAIVGARAVPLFDGEQPLPAPSGLKARLLVRDARG